jgi:hypothetical protein
MTVRERGWFQIRQGGLILNQAALVDDCHQDISSRGGVHIQFYVSHSHVTA